MNPSFLASASFIKITLRILFFFHFRFLTRVSALLQSDRIWHISKLHLIMGILVMASVIASDIATTSTWSASVSRAVPVVIDFLILGMAGAKTPTLVRPFLQEPSVKII